jgi:hypothetical protein
VSEGTRTRGARWGRCSGKDETAFDHGASDVREELLVGTGVPAQEGERLFHADPVRLRDEALRLFDDDAAVERALELLLRQVRVLERPLLQDADRRDVGECLGGQRVLAVERPSVSRNRLSDPRVVSRSRIGIECTDAYPDSADAAAKVGQRRSISAWSRTDTGRPVAKHSTHGPSPASSCSSPRKLERSLVEARTSSSCDWLTRRMPAAEASKISTTPSTRFCRSSTTS